MMTIKGARRQPFFSILLGLLMVTVLAIQSITVIGTDHDQNNEFENTRSPTKVPRPPMDVTGTVDGAKCTIRWKEPKEYGGGGGLNYYRVYRGVSIYHRTIIADHINASVKNLFFEDLTTEPATTYYYWVSVLNNVGESNLSQPLMLKTLGPKGPPGTIGLQVNDEEVKLTWIASNITDDKGITQSILERSTNSFSYMVIMTWTTDPLALIEYIDLTATRGRTYWYRVSIKIDDIITLTGKATELVFPGTPTSVIELHSKVHEDTITLIWDRPTNDGGSDLIGYRIKKGTKHNSVEEVDVVRPDDTDWTDPDPWLKESTYYVVVPYNHLGEGEVKYANVYLGSDDSQGEMSLCLLSLFLASMIPGLIAAGITWKVDKEKRERKEFDKKMEKMRGVGGSDGKKGV